MRYDNPRRMTKMTASPPAPTEIEVRYWTAKAKAAFENRKKWSELFTRESIEEICKAAYNKSHNKHNNVGTANQTE